MFRHVWNARAAAETASSTSLGDAKSTREGRRLILEGLGLNELALNFKGRDAAKAFEEVDREHPYSEWATRAEMMAAYAYYMSNQYDDAISAAKRYIDGNKKLSAADKQKIFEGNTRRVFKRFPAAL